MSPPSPPPPLPPLPHTTTPHSPLHLTTTPGTAIWRKSSFDIFTAPHRLTCALPLSTFSRARVTISGHWTGRHDSGGLLFVFSSLAHQQGRQHLLTHPRRWVCAGMGISKDGAADSAHMMVMSCEAGATDFSIHPRDGEDEGGEEATVEVRVERDLYGPSLWVYYLSADGSGAVKERHPMRELGWMFGHGWEEDGMVQVGVYCAMPVIGDAVLGKELRVTFKKLQVDWTTDDGDEE